MKGKITKLMVFKVISIVALISSFVVLPVKQVGAAILDSEILSNITSINNSSTSLTNPWEPDGTTKEVDFTIKGDALAQGSVLTTGKKQAVLAIPADLQGKVTPNGEATIATNITVPLNKVPLLSSTLTAVDTLGNLISRITSGAFGSLTNVDINLSDVQEKLQVVKNIENFGQASFSTKIEKDDNGSYLSVPVDDGLGLVVSKNLREALDDLKTAVNQLEAKGKNILAAPIASAINVAIAPVKVTVSTAVDTAVPLLQTGGAAVNQIADVAVLGKTTVTIPTKVTSPKNLDHTLSAEFVGSVIRDDVINVDLIRSGDGESTIYYKKSKIISIPVVEKIVGDSKSGYTVSGTADIGSNVLVFNKANEEVGQAVVGENGKYEVTLSSDKVSANEELTILARDELGNQSGTAPIVLPKDAVTKPNTPTVKHIEGDTQAGYTISGSADVGNTVIIFSDSNEELGKAIVGEDGKYIVKLPIGKVSENDKLTVIATNGEENKSDSIVITIPEALKDITINPMTEMDDTVTGNAPSGAKLRYFVDGQAVNVSMANTDGTYNKVIGIHKVGTVIGVQMQDPKTGKYRELKTITVTPVKVTLTVNEMTTNDTSVTGIAFKEARLRFLIDGKVVNTGRAGETGDFSKVIGAQKAGTVVGVQQLNPATGNYSDTVTTTVKAVATSVKVDAMTTSKTEISGTAPAGAKLRIIIGGQAVTVVYADAEGKFSKVVGNQKEGTVIGVELLNTTANIYEDAVTVTVSEDASLGTPAKINSISAKEGIISGTVPTAINQVRVWVNGVAQTVVKAEEGQFTWKKAGLKEGDIVKVDYKNAASKWIAAEATVIQ